MLAPLQAGTGDGGGVVEAFIALAPYEPASFHRDHRNVSTRTPARGQTVETPLRLHPAARDLLSHCPILYQEHAGHESARLPLMQLGCGSPTMGVWSPVILNLIKLIIQSQYFGTWRTHCANRN